MTDYAEAARRYSQNRAVVIGFSLHDFRDHLQPSSPGALLSEAADATEAWAEHISQ